MMNSLKIRPNTDANISPLTTLQFHLNVLQLIIKPKLKHSTRERIKLRTIFNLTIYVNSI